MKMAYNSAFLFLLVTLALIISSQSVLVAIVSAFNNPLTAELSGELTLNREGVSDWETWDLFPNADGTVSFRSHHGKYLTADPAGNVVADRDHASDWEKFFLDRMSETDNEKVAVRSFHNYFLCANHHHLESRAEAGEWETFTLLPIGVQEEVASEL